MKELRNLFGIGSEMTFSKEELLSATDDLCQKNIIGRGGFGCVYRGMLRHAQVAVKLLSEVCECNNN